ncbi:PHA/PHB synthase family protein [Streptomyces sp. NPDC057798]|uniref:PHA/PHB synthase family protein n=1 Tax=Streptomyces sp. NPDC057798 TaxID=3346252 RepID=UPI0036A9D5C0
MTPCDPPINPYESDASDDPIRALLRHVVSRVIPVAPVPGTDHAHPKRRASPEQLRACTLPWRLLSRGHALLRHQLLTAADSPLLPDARRAQLRFVAQLVADASAPANYLLTNPDALRLAVSSRGASVVRGTSNFLDDVCRRNGRPAKMRPGHFRLGVTLAATPGKVVHRNAFMELLQYEPQTPTVRTVPLLLIPAWVNKYYIYDLAPGRSLVEFAVRSGYNVFCLSLRDPRSGEALPDLDTYLTHCLVPALDVVRDITATSRAHLVGVCAGGLLAVALAAWLKEKGQPPAASLSLLNTALTAPGPAGTGPFPGSASPREIMALSWLLARDRHLISGRRLGLLFDLLRGDATVWGPLIDGWLFGERAPGFDLLAWSEDTIDMPRAVFEQTLRLATEDTLAKNRLTLADTPVRPSAVLAADTFVVAAERDHLVPWDIVYRSARLLGDDCTFRLVPSGHMGAIVSPPRPGAQHLACTGPLPLASTDWLRTAELREESWWEDWSRWLECRSGPLVPARASGNRRHPPGTNAPGRYAAHGWPRHLLAEELR